MAAPGYVALDNQEKVMEGRVSSDTDDYDEAGGIP